MPSFTQIILILFLILALLVGGAVIYFVVDNHSARSLAVKEQGVAGAAVAGQHQVQAAQAAQQIVVSGQARDRVDLEVHDQNAQAILAARGADAPVDPAALRAANVGLCGHAAVAADPRCPGLLKGGPGLLPGSNSLVPVP